MRMQRAFLSTSFTLTDMGSTPLLRKRRPSQSRAHTFFLKVRVARTIGLYPEETLRISLRKRVASMSFSMPVSGRDFANLLAETGCQHVVLNACRSAHVGGSDANNALSSFSDELVRRGAHVVVSMRYNVYVASALRFIGEFYRQLGRGQSLVSAASLASKNLATDPARDGIDR